MMKNNKLIKSGLIYTLGNLLIQALGIITLPIYTRVLNVDEYGSYSLYSSWVAIVLIFISVQSSGSFSIAKIKYKDEFENYVATTTTLISILFSFILVIVIVFHGIFEKILGFSTLIVILIFIQSYFNYLSGSYSQYLVQKQDSKIQMMISFATAIGGAILSIALVFWMVDKFMARVIGVFIPSIVVAVLFVVYIYKKSNVVFEKKYIKFIFVISIPLLFHILGHQLLTQLDRIMLGKYIGTSAVAVYSFGYSLAMILQVVLSSLNTAWVPWYFEEKKKNNLALVANYREKYIVLGIFLTIGYLSVFPELANFMGSEAYREYVNYIILIILSYFIVFLYTFPVNVQFFYENTKYIPIGTLAAAAINYVLNIFLIKLYGISGAAVSTLVSYLTLLLFHHLVAKLRYNDTEISVKEYVVSFVSVGLYAVFSNYFIDIQIIRWLGCIVVFVILVVYYRDDIQKFVKNYRK